MKRSWGLKIGYLLLVSFWLLTGSNQAVAEPPEGILEGYRLLYSQDFADVKSLDQFTKTDPNAWAHTIDDGKGALELRQQSKYKPPHRSPLNIALLNSMQFGDFVLEADCLQTGREYGHRDMIFVFGFQDPANYYYVHIATKGDDNANQVFLVKDAPRTKISLEANEGNNWGLETWRKVRIVRQASTGAIKVYFEDMQTPIMLADDKTFNFGWIGFGSFDDTGKIANIKIWGPEAIEKTVPAFAPQ